jgi:hypothetical protein
MNLPSQKRIDIVELTALTGAVIHLQRIARYKPDQFDSKKADTLLTLLDALGKIGRKYEVNHPQISNLLLIGGSRNDPPWDANGFKEIVLAKIMDVPTSPAVRA